MFFEDLEKALEKIYTFERQRFTKDQLKQLKIFLLQLLEKEGFMKGIIFKHGIFITIYGLKTYNQVGNKLKQEYLDSFTTGHPPDTTAKFTFGTQGFCMALAISDLRCRFDDAPCPYYKTRKWTVCEFINKEIKKMK